VEAGERPPVTLEAGGGLVDADHEATVLHPEEPPIVEPSGLGSEPQARRKQSMLRTVIEIVVIVAAFLVKPFTIHQVSMEPTLDESDRILINRVTYHFREPKNGDVVVFHSPVTAGEDLVKRVVAVGGDKVEVSGGKLYVNGVEQTEPYLLEQGFAGEYPETLIGVGQLFVMVYWPIGHWRGL
jgi:signal peptidase I